MNKYIVEDAEQIADSSISWDKLRGKSILIAGANGYVPQFFVHGLLKRNDKYDEDIHVIALCRNEKKANDRFLEYYGRNDFELIISDVTDKFEYSGKIDYIIHAASPASLKNRYNNPVKTFDANVIGAKNLLELAKEKKAEFLFLSSVDVYGKMQDNSRLVENKLGNIDILEPRNAYSCAKRTVESLCVYYNTEGVICKIVRPYQIIGSGLELDDGRLHIDFVSQILSKNHIVLKGDGSPRRTFLYVTDAITGMLTVMLDGSAGEAYNVVSEKNEASVLELANLMCSLVSDKKVEISYNMETRRNDPSVTKVISVVCGDSSKISSLGWLAKVSLEESCRRMMQYYGINVK